MLDLHALNRNWAYGGLGLPDGVVARARVTVPTLRVVALLGGNRADGLAPYLAELAAEANVRVERGVSDEADVLFFVVGTEHEAAARSLAGAPIPMLVRGPTVLLDIGTSGLVEVSPGRFYTHSVPLPDGGMTAEGLPSALGYAAWAGQIWNLCAPDEEKN